LAERARPNRYVSVERSSFFHSFSLCFALVLPGVAHCSTTVGSLPDVERQTDRQTGRAEARFCRMQTLNTGCLCNSLIGDHRELGP
jgi:hypothetical protein